MGPGRFREMRGFGARLPQPSSHRRSRRRDARPRPGLQRRHRSRRRADRHRGRWRRLRPHRALCPAPRAARGPRGASARGRADRGLRALVDQYEALLSGAREVTVFWTGSGRGRARPKVLGQAPASCRPGQRPEAILNFGIWLPDASAEGWRAPSSALRVEGRAFDLPLKTRDGQPVRALGSARAPAPCCASSPRRAVGPDGDATADADLARARSPRCRSPPSSATRAARLIFANAAYLDARATRSASPARESRRPARASSHARRRKRDRVVARRRRHLRARRVPGRATAAPAILVAQGRARAARARRRRRAPRRPHRCARDAGRDLRREARAGAVQPAPMPSSGGSIPSWLQPGLDERAILDRLRTDGMLPAEADYHAWRAQAPRLVLQPHRAARERSLAPARRPHHQRDRRAREPRGRRDLCLRGHHRAAEAQEPQQGPARRAALDPQRAHRSRRGVRHQRPADALQPAALDASGSCRRTCSARTRTSTSIAEACGRAMPEDGAAIWRDLKRAIIDLNPTRTDASGRITARRRQAHRLRRRPPARRADDDDLPRCHRERQLQPRAQGAQRGAGDRRPAEGRVRPERQLRAALAAHQHHRLCRPARLGRGRAAQRAPARLYRLHPRLERDARRPHRQHPRSRHVDAGIAAAAPRAAGRPPSWSRRRAPASPRPSPRSTARSRSTSSSTCPRRCRRFIADGTRIVQVLYNLLSNAARFSEPGAPIRLSVTARGERMLFIVEDEGAAMSEEMRAEHARGGADPGLAGRQRGAGLGLAIVRTFVNLHGGTDQPRARASRAAAASSSTCPPTRARAGSARQPPAGPSRWPQPSSSPTMPRPPRSARSSRRCCGPAT